MYHLYRSIDLLQWICKFFKVNCLRNQFFSTKVVLVTFSSPEMTFSRNSDDSTFSFWLYSLERKRAICGNFSLCYQFPRFLSNCKIWHYTDFRNFRMDTTCMFFCQNNTVSKILVLTTFDTWGNLFFLTFWQVSQSKMASQ